MTEPEYLTTAEAAAYYTERLGRKVTTNNVNSWRHSGAFPGAKKIGEGLRALYLLPRAEVEAFQPRPYTRRKQEEE